MPNKEPTKECEKEFDENFPVVMIDGKIPFWQISDDKKIKSFISQAIQEAVSAREAELIEKLEEKIANLPHGAHSRITLREVIALIKG